MWVYTQEMKIPRVLFVKHVPSLSPERKTFLTQHLEERVPLGTDVRWFEDLNYDHPFVEWVQQRYRLPYGTKLTSNFIKTCQMFQMMVDENIESAICIDDDVMFHKDWVSILESINFSEIPQFINLGTFLRDDLARPRHGTVYVCGNNGGCEGAFVSLEFAKLFLKNINMHHAIDIIVHAILHSMGHKVLNIPVCHQTSCLEKHTTLDHDTRVEMPWMEYVSKYATLPKMSYDDMHAEYTTYRHLKKQKEDKLFELYGKRINVKNVEYIIGESPEYCNDILKF